MIFARFPPLLLAALLALGLSAAARAQDLSANSFSAENPTVPPRPAPRAASPGRLRIGLALSGGGARGAAHVGVLKALEELHVPVDYVAGTSMGSIVGGLYASGMSPEQIEQVFQQADWRYLLSDAPPRPSQDLRDRQRDFDLDQNIRFGISNKGELKLPAGLVAGRKLLVNLREQTLPVRAINDFDRLPVPFRAVATDLETGDKVVIDHGNLAEAMRASMAVPGVFTPYRIDNHLLVDGGLSSNLPIETVRQMGADIIIAVDVRSVLLKERDLGSAFAVTNQMLDIYIKQETEREVKTLGGRDIYIRLPLEGATSIGFLTAAENIPAGYKETMKHAAELRALAESPAEYRRLLASRRVPRSTTAADISFVRIDSPSGPVRQELKEKIPFKPGERIEFSDLNSHLIGLDGLRGYEVTDFDVVEENGQLGLELKARKRADGPNFLHIGGDFNYGTPGITDANLRIEWRMTELNRLGGEWDTLLSIGDQTRVYTEFYQPFGVRQHFFLAPFAYYNSELIDARDADDVRRRFRLQDLRAGLDAGFRLGQIGELRLGYAYGLTDISRTINLPEGTSESATRGEAHAILSIDTLDRSGFPTKGWFSRTEALLSNRMLGARDDYGRLDAELFKPLTFGQNTFVPRVTAGVQLGGGSLPYYDRSSLGGFLNLSGLTRRDLYDQNALLAELIYYRQIAKLPPGFGSGIYGGASIEAGNVWGKLSDASATDAIVGGSLFLGAESILGPLSLGVGASGDGHTAVYLQLGPAFGRGRLDR